MTQDSQALTGSQGAGASQETQAPQALQACPPETKVRGFPGVRTMALAHPSRGISTVLSLLYRAREGTSVMPPAGGKRGMEPPVSLPEAGPSPQATSDRKKRVLFVGSFAGAKDKAGPQARRPTLLCEQHPRLKRAATKSAGGDARRPHGAGCPRPQARGGLASRGHGAAEDTHTVMAVGFQVTGEVCLVRWGPKVTLETQAALHMNPACPALQDGQDCKDPPGRLDHQDLTVSGGTKRGVWCVGGTPLAARCLGFSGDRI